MRMVSRSIMTICKFAYCTCICLDQVLPLQGKRYANYWWVDGVYTNLLAEKDPRTCVLVIIGFTAQGKKELVSVSDGLRD
jgi:hypothetical protein